MSSCLQRDHCQLAPAAASFPRFRGSTLDLPQSRLAERARELLSTEIEFIANDCFFAPDADDQILSQPIHAPRRRGRESPSVEDDTAVPSNLARLCDHELLGKQEEPVLFRRMNYLKFKANRLRSAIDLEQPDPKRIERIEAMLDEAREMRDRIIQANTRLVMAVVKRHLSPLLTWEEMFSDGVLTLMMAVDKFDYDRGFRFSTYAYHSISRAFFRTIRRRNNEKKRYSFRQDDDLTNLEETRNQPEADERQFLRQQNLLGEMLEQLDDREQFIIQGRFGLGAETKALTLRAIGEQLRLSKERVRQLEQNAVEKMKAFAQELAISCPLGNA
jgi:RNA polymerase primary sigma factor